MSSKYFNNFLIVAILTSGIVSSYQLIRRSSFFQPAAQVIAETTPGIQIIGDGNSPDTTSSRLIRVKVNPSGHIKNGPVTYRIANSVPDLNYATAQTLDLSNPIINWNLTSGNGQKQVYLQFRTTDGWLPPVSDSTMLDAPVPTTFQTGFNIPSIVEYPYQDIRPFAHDADVDTDLKAVSGAGSSVVRVMVGDDRITDDEAAARLGDFLNEADIYGIQVIPVLIDALSSNHNPLGADLWYAPSASGSVKLSPGFYKAGYKDEFSLFVRKVVGANRNHKNIYAWEIENGLGETPDDNFTAFAKDISSTIKGIDPFHQLALGVPYSQALGLTPLQLYNSLPDVDILSVSSVDGDYSGITDLNWARESGKTAVVDDLVASSSATPGRSLTLKQGLDFWRSHGVSAVLLGNLVAKGLRDNGDLDKNYGIDDITHSDYGAILSVLKPYAQVLGASVALPQNLTYDLDGDGVVDKSDLEVFLSALKLHLGGKRYDFNHDGQVDILDLSLLLNHLSR